MRQTGREGECIIMPEKNYEDIKHEQASWLKTLDRLRQENVHLKNKLSEIIQDDISRELLEKAEFFHGLFVDKDTVISLLRRDIAHQSAATTAFVINGERLGIMDEQVKLEHDVARMEKEFKAVKTEFNEFLKSIP